MTFEEMDKAVDERINGTESPVYTKAVEILKDLNAQVLWLAQVNQDQKLELQAVRGELAFYKNEMRKQKHRNKVLIHRVK